MVSEVWCPDAATIAVQKKERQVSTRLLALGFLAVGALFFFFHEDEAFVSGVPVERPAGYSVVVDKLPKGLTCSAAYGDTSERPEWLPYTQWRGEKSFHPVRELQADKNRQWYHFDAEGKTLGHLAQAIAAVLLGKDNPLWDPLLDIGAFAVVTNCERVRVSGKKYHYKLYMRNLSKRPGHMKIERFKDLQKRFPERIIMRAVWGAMPRSRSSRRIFKDRLKLFAGPNHLYYDREPIAYPMHTVKDCTPTQNIRHKDRLEVFYGIRSERALKVKQWAETKENNIKLRLYKNFLLGQMEEQGPEAVERMELDEFVEKAENDRMRRVYETTEGVEIPKPKKKFWFGTNIERFKVSNNRKSLRR